MFMRMHEHLFTCYMNICVSKCIDAIMQISTSVKAILVSMEGHASMELMVSIAHVRLATVAPFVTQVRCDDG